MKRAFKATRDSRGGRSVSGDGLVSGDTFKPHVEAGAIIEEAKLKRTLKRANAKNRESQEERVENGLRYLASQPDRICCVNGCSGTPAYRISKVFYCFKHKNQARAHRKLATMSYYES